ncbi:MAG: O-acetyl-ADP-ribose deacetylase [Thermoplasmata archaeon HGW-Thermoplasmata-1]|nr:MAG: O-acetyl-ADP-ribose deacetylase [Thermoplasmata archaeon HGW-Thermoplasmata-1]
MDGRVETRIGDITKLKVGAIVNAANPSILGGGGVDGAIHRAGGGAILEECRRIRANLYPNGLPTGKAVATAAGVLAAKYVIHTVGPIWHGGHHGEAALLADSYHNSLAVAAANGCDTVAFPAISTGVYGFPKDLAAQAASCAISDFLEKNALPQKVILVFYKRSDEDAFPDNCVF